MIAIRTANTHMPPRNAVILSAAAIARTSGTFVRAECGSSAIKRAASVRISRCTDSPSDNAAIDATNLWVAVSDGNRASSAASCQGSRPNRASAESTLSGMSFLSSPIGANKKSLNSDPRPESGAGRAILVTELRRFYREPLHPPKPNHIAWQRFHGSPNICRGRSTRRFVACGGPTSARRRGTSSPEIII